MNELRVFGEPARVVKREGPYILVETSKAYWILVEKDFVQIPVQGFSKEMYSLEDVLEEFYDFVRV